MARTFPPGSRYRVSRAMLPTCLVDGIDLPADKDGLALADFDVADGRIVAIRPHSGPELGMDLDSAMVLPCFADLHTHLDKGHIWERADNPDGTHDGALMSVRADRAANWNAEDVHRRFEFSLRCAYAHGTAAIRTHIDSLAPQAAISWPAFAALRDSWAGRVELQAACIVPVDLYRDADAGRELANLVADHGGLLGGVVLTRDSIDDVLDTLFTLARERNLDIDLHMDETTDPLVRGLAQLAEATRRHGYEGRVTAGHCCSLSAQPELEAERTMTALAAAGVSVVGLPMCNLYLQDRGLARTPRLRGVTALHELRAHGVRTAIASDNTRDPFYAYGDMDMIEVLREGIRIGQLDRPIGDWPRAFTSTPADVMDQPAIGRLKVDGPADFIICEGRRWSEVLSRPEPSRIVVRNGKPTGAQVPSFRELDDLALPA